MVNSNGSGSMMPNSNTGQISVSDTVIMYAVRKIGKNVPLLPLTYFVDEAEKWKEEQAYDNLEIVVVNIKPYIGEE